MMRFIACCFTSAGATFSLLTLVPLLADHDWHANATLWMCSAIAYAFANLFNFLSSERDTR